MADAEMIMVFCYDVSRSSDRRRVAAVLEASAVRVQQSVFEARLSRAAADRLLEAASRELGPGDSLRMYAIGAHGAARSKTIGGAPLPEAQDFYLL